ncbi:GIY-YIG nuclease family protein [Solibacillus sp. FSL H8-0538]|uniref:GIY-YIG nuclease family protein n=1 Tax=Solibacillus sp. FSL H8-0538 TaxID=2921400 RepID=UPI0030FCD02B
MERKKELKLQYKDSNKVEAGVYKIENKRNGLVFIASTRNFKTLNGVRFSLSNNTHIHKTLQQDWKLFGEENFTFECLETLNIEELIISEKEALAEMEEKWVNCYKENLYDKY